MKKRIVIIIFCVILILGITFSITMLKPPAAGVWWWNDELDTETYLSFAADNDINEIYFCTSKFNDETEAFISEANSKSIDVYWLAGEYEWLYDHSGLLEQIDRYLAYQNKYTDAKFSGIHLDIEPHQSPEFKTDRYQLIYSLIDLANILKETYPAVKFDYALPFWLHDEISYNDQTKPAYEHMMDAANRIFLMSYRDSADDILDISKEEIGYAEKQNKNLVLCVETYSNEGDKVSFHEEGKQVMREEIDKLREAIPRNFGISIHHIKTWYELED